MTPDERAARLHLTDAAVALRTASERLCDWLEATGQDVAGNGHVASADEAAGSSREAPTAPVSSSPPPIPLGAVVTVTVNGVEWQREDGEWDDAEGGGPPNKADALDFLDRIAELEREVHLARNDEALALSTSREWESYCKRAERERDEARRELAEKEQQMADALAPFGYEFMDPPDGGDVPFGVQIARMGSALVEARRALAAKQDQGLGASAPNSEGQGPMIPTDGPPSPAPSTPRRCRFVEADGTPSELYEWGANSPAPASAPLSDPAPLSGAGNTGEIGKARRWWLVVNWRGDDVATRSDVLAAAAVAVDRDTRFPLARPHTVVPVVEARVTREMVERVAESLFRASEGSKYQVENTIIRAHWMDQARAALSALGLTVEGDDHA